MQNDWLHFVAQFLQTQTCVLQTRSTICSKKQLLGLLHHLVCSSCSSDYPSALNSQSCSHKKCAPCTHENFLFSNKCTICNKNKIKQTTTTTKKQKIMCKSFKQVLCKISSSNLALPISRNCYCWNFNYLFKTPLYYKGENRITSEIPKEWEANILSQVFQTT